MSERRGLHVGYNKQRTTKTTLLGLITAAKFPMSNLELSNLPELGWLKQSSHVYPAASLMFASKDLI